MLLTEKSFYSFRWLSIFIIILLLQSTFQSPPKQKKNNKSKLSQLFAEQGILIDFLVQVGFVSLVDEHGLEEAIKQFFKK